MIGKTIRQFLIDGKSDGRWTSELSNWTGKAYKIPRTHINLCSDITELDSTGVYFLFGRNDETEKPKVYIGESENILNRLKQHLQGKDFWTECIVFISKDNNLNKAHIKYLENHIYNMAKKAKRYEVNQKTPTESSISEMDRAEMDEFIDNMCLILGVLGHKVLEPSINNKNDRHIPNFTFKGNDFNAKGKQVSEGFAVLIGSKISNNISNSLTNSIMKKRDSLLDKGVIDNNLTFTEDYVFTSPSLAAAIVSGYSVNGRTAWKNKNGLSLKEIESKK